MPRVGADTHGSEVTVATARVRVSAVRLYVPSRHRSDSQGSTASTEPCWGSGIPCPTRYPGGKGQGQASETLPSLPSVKMKREEQYCIPGGRWQRLVLPLVLEKEQWWFPPFYHLIQLLEPPKMRWVLADESGLRERAELCTACAQDSFSREGQSRSHSPEAGKLHTWKVFHQVSQCSCPPS